MKQTSLLGPELDKYISILDPNFRTNEDLYKKIRAIGHGRYSKVYEVKKESGEKYAMKVIENLQDYNDISNIVINIALLTKCQHKNIIQFYYYDYLITYPKNDQNKLSFTFYMFYELGEYNLNKLSTQFTIPQMKKMIKNVFSALLYLNANELAHGYIKPTNIIYINGLYKLTDMGFSKFAYSKVKTLTIKDSDIILFMSPEQIQLYLQHNHHELNQIKSDVFSFGLSLLHIAGCNEINEISQISKNEKLDLLIEDKIYKVEQIFSNPSLSSLLRQMLKVNPIERGDFYEICYQACTNGAFLEGEDLESDGKSSTEAKIKFFEQALKELFVQNGLYKRKYHEATQENITLKKDLNEHKKKVNDLKQLHSNINNEYIKARNEYPTMIKRLEKRINELETEVKKSKQVEELWHKERLDFEVERANLNRKIEELMRKNKIINQEKIMNMNYRSMKQAQEDKIQLPSRTQPKFGFSDPSFKVHDLNTIFKEDTRPKKMTISWLETDDLKDLTISTVMAISQHNSESLNIDCGNFARSLSIIKNLEYVKFNMSNNNIDDYIACGFFFSIQNLPNVKSLSINLSENNITDQAIYYFAEKTLPTYKNLTCLELNLSEGENQLTNPGFECLIEEILKLPLISSCILELKNGKNDITKEFKEEMEEKMKKKIFRFKIDINNVNIIRKI